MKEIKSTIHAKDTPISVISNVGKDDYISLTDIARYKNPDAPKDVVKNWMRLKDTIDFLGLWEQLNNPNFKGVEFDSFKNQAGANAFTLSPQQWISATGAIGIVSKSGRYGGGTFAHKDIAFEFASWVSPEFKLYVIQDYQRLKQSEAFRNSLDWSVKRLLSKANYRIHTDAVKTNLIPQNLSKQQIGCIYAEEADVLNVALFGKTAAEWRTENPKTKGNMRDYATIEQLLVLSNLENHNARFIQEGIEQRERLLRLRDIAVAQLQLLTDNKSVRQLGELEQKHLTEKS